jgi:hypothetical protein
MQMLAEQIRSEIEARGLCAVYWAELNRVWPNPKNREAAVREFATAQGWDVGFYKDGFVAISTVSKRKTRRG